MSNANENNFNDIRIFMFNNRDIHLLMSDWHIERGGHVACQFRMFLPGYTYDIFHFIPVENSKHTIQGQQLECFITLRDNESTFLSINPTGVDPFGGPSRIEDYEGQSSGGGAAYASRERGDLQRMIIKLIPGKPIDDERVVIQSAASLEVYKKNIYLRMDPKGLNAPIDARYGGGQVNASTCLDQFTFLTFNKPIFQK